MAFNADAGLLAASNYGQTELWDFVSSVADMQAAKANGEIGLQICLYGPQSIKEGLDLLYVQLADQLRQQIREMSQRIKEAANAQLTVQHPPNPDVSGIDIVTFYGPAPHPDAAYPNVHVFADGQVDRSPSGTGTSAMLAYFLAKGEIDEGTVNVAQGLAGGLFEGRIVTTWEQDGQCYITPDIAGRAFLTRVHSFYLDSADPMLQGLAD